MNSDDWSKFLQFVNIALRLVEPLKLHNIPDDQRVHIDSYLIILDSNAVLVIINLGIVSVPEGKLDLSAKSVNQKVVSNTVLLSEDVLHHVMHNVCFDHFESAVLVLVRLFPNTIWYEHFTHVVPVH